MNSDELRRAEMLGQMLKLDILGAKSDLFESLGRLRSQEYLEPCFKEISTNLSQINVLAMDISGKVHTK